MSIASGPNSVVNGLLFDYDMSNTKRSWIGMPTTNLAAFNVAVNGFSTDTPANLTQTSNSSEATYQGRLSRKMVVGAGYWNSYIYSYNTGVSSTVFAVSFKVKVNDGSHPNAFMSGGYIYGSAGNTYPALTFQLIDDGWYLASCTYSGASMTLNSLTGMNGTSPGAKTFYIVDYQAEAQTFASPFVNGTRSTDQSILDLANRSTATVSNLIYASDNTFSFNGPNSSSVSVPLATAFNKLEGTINMWVYPTAYDGGNGYFVNRDDATPNAVDWFWIGPYSGTFYFRLGNGSDCCSNDLSVGSWASYVPLNTWTNICFTWKSAGTSVIYINGTALTSRAISAVPSTNPSTNGRIGLGHANNYSFYTGKLPSAQIYSRQLTDIEVTQNFNALRGRYGI